MFERIELTNKPSDKDKGTNMTIQTLDNNKLVDFALSNEMALSILDDCAGRERMRWETNLGRYAVTLAKKGVKVVQEPYMETWKGLEKLGVGVIIYGRGNNPTRFRWHYSLKDVGNAAIHPEKKTVLKYIEPKKEIKSKRGRPLGSKNIQKAAPESDVASKIKQVTKLLEEIAKLSA